MIGLMTGMRWGKHGKPGNLTKSSYKRGRKINEATMKNLKELVYDT